jgi:hypothetical protein
MLCRQRNLVHAATLLALGLATARCGDDAKQSGGKKTKPATDAGDTTGDGDGGDGSNAPKDTTGGTPEATSALDLWCERAAEIDPVKGALASMYGDLCADGKATKLLKATLVESAYDGTNSVHIEKLAAYASDLKAKTTKGYLGVGIKLPGTAKQHFDEVGPKGGDVPSLLKLATAQGAQGEAEVLDTYDADGKYQVRGWKIHSRNTKNLIVIQVVTDTVSRTDQFQLEDGKAYAFTQQTLEAREGIKGFDQLTASVQIGDAAYLLTLARMEVGNFGLPAAAESEIEKTAQAMAKTMYDAAAGK